MVKVIEFKQRKTEEGKTFNALIVLGGIEPVKSKTTGNTYFTAKMASVPSTFSDEMCSSMIGIELDGKVKRVECEPFEFTIKETGETIQRSHRYEYVNEALELVENNVVETEEVM